jgi:PAS domain-containing protein
VDIGKYWKTIFDTLQDGLMVFDMEGNILAANPAAVRLTGYSANELIGSNCRILNCTGCELYGRGSGKGASQKVLDYQKESKGGARAQERIRAI